MPLALGLPAPIEERNDLVGYACDRVTHGRRPRGLTARLLLYDALQARFSTLAYTWDPENPLNGRAPRFYDLSHHREALTERFDEPRHGLREAMTPTTEWRSYYQQLPERPLVAPSEGE